MDEIQSSRHDGTTSVYRYFDKNGILIYVGITGRGMARNSEHNKTQEWWQYVTRQEVEHYATRRAAHNVEKQLIRQHHPPFNVQHNPEHAVVRATYLEFRRENIPMDAASLVRRSGSQHRLTLAPVHRTSSQLVLISLPEDRLRVAAIDIEAATFDLASGGRSGRVESITVRDGLLRVAVNVRDAEKCGGGELMLRFPNGKGRPTIKRVDLLMPGRVSRKKNQGL